MRKALTLASMVRYSYLTFVIVLWHACASEAEVRTMWRWALHQVSNRGLTDTQILVLVRLGQTDETTSIDLHQPP